MLSCHDRCRPAFWCWPLLMLLFLESCSAGTIPRPEIPATETQSAAIQPPEVPSSTPTADPSATPASAIWRPEPGTTWQWQIEDGLDSSYDVQVYDIDLFNTPASLVTSLHSRGIKVICYIDVGSFEDWRPDHNLFPPSIIGNPYSGWPGEWWLDIRQIDALGPIIGARLDLCRSKGFDGVEPDNISAYGEDTGFPITAEDQLTYNKWLAQEAHSRGLSIGLKNDTAQILALQPYFDWALAENCFSHGWCALTVPFIASGKAVFAAESSDNIDHLDQYCNQAKLLRISLIWKDPGVPTSRRACP